MSVYNFKVKANPWFIYLIYAMILCCLPDLVASSPACIGTCYTGEIFPVTQDIFHRKHLKGHSYKNITTDDQGKCYRHCAQDCRCKACQMKDATCELLDEDKTSKAGDFVNRPGYVYFDLRQTMYQGTQSHMVGPGECYNGCCRSQPCLNGGICVEHCASPKEKFKCKCPTHLEGKLCEIIQVDSCISILKKSLSIPADGLYRVKQAGNEKKVYCDFVGKNQAWTLIESFNSRSNPFKTVNLHVDNPVNEDDHNWDLYRLDKRTMMHLRTKSTLFRATCDFPNRISLTPDLLIGKLSELDIFDNQQRWPCQKYKFIDVRGYNCSDCTAFTAYGTIHIHIDVTQPYCNFNPPHEKYNVDSFGFYDFIDEKSKCTETQRSTTQWWLGSEI